MSEFQKMKAQKRAILARQEKKKWQNWVPTAENVNALPGPVRQYVHDLETRCDPSGDVRELVVARDTANQLESRIEELEEACRDYEKIVVLHEDIKEKLKQLVGTYHLMLAAIYYQECVEGYYDDGEEYCGDGD
jgi:hypothetical protein